MEQQNYLGEQQPEQDHFPKLLTKYYTTNKSNYKEFIQMSRLYNRLGKQCFSIHKYLEEIKMLIEMCRPQQHSKQLIIKPITQLKLIQAKQKQHAEQYVRLSKIIFSKSKQNTKFNNCITKIKQIIKKYKKKNQKKKQENNEIIYIVKGLKGIIATRQQLIYNQLYPLSKTYDNFQLFLNLYDKQLLTTKSLIPNKLLYIPLNQNLQVHPSFIRYLEKLIGVWDQNYLEFEVISFPNRPILTWLIPDKEKYQDIKNNTLKKLWFLVGKIFQYIVFILLSAKFNEYLEQDQIRIHFNDQLRLVIRYGPVFHLKDVGFGIKELLQRILEKNFFQSIIKTIGQLALSSQVILLQCNLMRKSNLTIIQNKQIIRMILQKYK